MKFSLSCKVTVSAYTEVEANSLDEAIEAAKELPGLLSFNGSGNTATDGWLVEEVDGEPFDITEV